MRLLFTIALSYALAAMPPASRCECCDCGADDAAACACGVQAESAPCCDAEHNEACCGSELLRLPGETQTRPACTCDGTIAPKGKEWALTGPAPGLVARVVAPQGWVLPQVALAERVGPAIPRPSVFLRTCSFLR